MNFVGAGWGDAHGAAHPAHRGGGAPTANDHARLLEDVARERSERERADRGAE